MLNIIKKEEKNRKDFCCCIEDDLYKKFTEINNKKCIIPFPTPCDYKFTFIDIFSGIGGFRIGLQKIGGKCILSSDINDHSRSVYYSNFGEHPFGDIRNVNKEDIPSHDILTAGFPCQPFSISGLKKGFDDERGGLIYDILEIVKNKNPKVIFLENVKHLIHHNKGKTFNIIINSIEKLGYKVSYQLVNASDFGVPQNRERIIIIGHHKRKFDFSKIKKDAKIAIKHFLDPYGDFDFLDKNEYTLIENPTRQDSGLIFCGYRNKKIRKAGVRIGTEHLSRVHKQPNRIYSSEGVHPTLPSQETSGRFWIYHEGKVRKLTINECYRIMGFPDSFVKSTITGEQYKQIGNSVSIPMIERIGIEILKQLF